MSPPAMLVEKTPLVMKWRRGRMQFNGWSLVFVVGGFPSGFGPLSGHEYFGPSRAPSVSANPKVFRATNQNTWADATASVCPCHESFRALYGKSAPATWRNKALRPTAARRLYV